MANRKPHSLDVMVFRKGDHEAARALPSPQAVGG
jgi:hypothetical protein